MKYNKLVRDKIPEILKSKNVVFSSHVANEDEYKEKLLQKLKEEVNEFLEEPSIEELADVEEVLLAIREGLNFSKEEIEKARIEKAQKRGEFKERIILEEAD